jgi:hypothetical protein
VEESVSAPIGAEASSGARENVAEPPIVVRLNRAWSRWALAADALLLLASAWFLTSGLQAMRSRGSAGLMLIVIGVVGVAAAAYFARVSLRTLRAPWRLEVSRSHMALYTQAYDLRVPWEQVTGIVVSEVDRRLGCALVFADAAAVAQGAEFHRVPGLRDAVRDAERMRERMEECFSKTGYHLGIRDRALELGPEALAKLLAGARTGELWQERAE